jgi:regulator of sigma E protease
MNIIWQIIIGTIVIGLLALVHELGHFTAAKLSGIAVEELSIGFGPTIYQKKVKETVYKVGALPILGYAKIKGMEGDFDAPDGYYKKGFWQRFFTIFMGPGMNFILAIVIFAIVFSTFGNPFVPTTTVGALVENGPAYRAGIQAGDKIIEVNGTDVRDNWDKMTEVVRSSKGKALNITVDRKGKKITFSVTPKKDPTTQTWVVGIYRAGMRYSFFEALWQGTIWTGKLLYKMFIFIPMLFTKQGITSVAGPIGIIAITGQAASGGLMNLLWFSAFISIALGFTNLLPLPALDGSWLVLLIWEGITHKPVPPEKQMTVQGTGFVILLGLMVLISIHDIMRFFVK